MRALRSVQAERIAVARDVNPVQPHQRKPSRKRPQPRPDRTGLRQHAPHRPHPEPVVEVADDKGSRRLHQIDQRMGLGVPFMDAQAEVGRNDPHLACDMDNMRAAMARRGSRS